jgi:hypothetical protein
MILDYYKKLLNEHKNLDSQDKIKLTQNQALQLIFDLKFLHTLFDLKSTGVYLNVGSSEHLELNKKFQRSLEDYNEVCSLLESFVDPFDYDICTPFIQSKLAKCISRSAVKLKTL